MADLRIEEYNVGDIGTNCYFIVNADTKEMVIIDPGGDGADLIRRIKERGLKLQAVLLTHGHYDHAGGLKDFVESKTHIMRVWWQMPLAFLCMQARKKKLPCTTFRKMYLQCLATRRHMMLMCMQKTVMYLIWQDLRSK